MFVLVFPMQLCHTTIDSRGKWPLTGRWRWTNSTYHCCVSITISALQDLPMFVYSRPLKGWQSKAITGRLHRSSTAGRERAPGNLWVITCDSFTVVAYWSLFLTRSPDSLSFLGISHKSCEIFFYNVETTRRLIRSPSSLPACGRMWSEWSCLRYKIFTQDGGSYRAGSWIHRSTMQATRDFYQFVVQRLSAPDMIWRLYIVLSRYIEQGSSMVMSGG